MIKAEFARQLMLRTDDSLGTLAEVTSVVSSSNINQIAICAYEVNGQVAIMFVTDDNNEAKKLLTDRGFQLEEQEVILLSLDNTPGALQHVTDKIAEAGINLSLIYGSVAEEADVSRIVLIAENNLDIMMVIKTQLERA